MKETYNPEEFQESRFGVRSPEDLSHIFSILRSKLYADKILAVLREYSTNAMDAHIDSGQPDRPIEVSLPSYEDPYLKIRDFGKGLSEENIRSVYTMYGASTKRGNNQFNGQLGLGAKSLYSYTDNWHLISWNEGKRTVYEVYLDESGLGAISLIAQDEDLESPSGIEISTKVQYQDFESFYTKAKYLYKFFQVTPLVTQNYLPVEIEPIKYSIQKENWGITDSSSNKLLIMSNVAYPISWNILKGFYKNHPKADLFNALSGTSVNFFVPTGTVNIAASREALEYDKVTCQALIDLFEKVTNELIEHINTSIASSEDIVQAKDTLAAINNTNLCIIVSQNKNFTWQGKPINKRSFILPDKKIESLNNTGNAEVFGLKFYGRTVKRQHNGSPSVSQYIFNNSICFTGNARVFYEDVSDKPILRIRQFFLDNPTVDVCFLIKLSKEVYSLTQFAEELGGVPEKYFHKLSSIQSLKNTKRAGKANSKYTKKVFTFKSTNETTTYKDSSWWDIDHVPTDETRYYLKLNQFQPVLPSGHTLSARRFLDSRQVFSSITNTDLPIPIVGIKLSIEEKDIPIKWKPLNEYVDQVLKDKEVDIKNLLYTHTLGEYLLNTPLWVFRTENGFIRNYLERIQSGQGLFFEAITQVNLGVSQVNYFLQKFEYYFGTELFFSWKMGIQEQVQQLLNNVYDRYPLLSFIGSQVITREQIGPILDYVEAIEGNS